MLLGLHLFNRGCYHYWDSVILSLVYLGQEVLSTVSEPGRAGEREEQLWFL